MKVFCSLFSHCLIFCFAFSQSADEGVVVASYHDVITFNNGVSLSCEVVEVAENIVFYEQIPSSGLLSASLSEVKDIKRTKDGLRTLSDSTKAMKNNPLYQQGRQDAKKYYLIHLKNIYNNPKNPRNAMLSNPSYAAGYKDGAQSKKNRRLALIWLCSPLFLPIILGFLFRVLVLFS